ncbi:hypothetical protein KP509_30G039300 [Ceratopteris richardii]|uniref:Uncharacterized protein n=2 Tax=Ceratopteris richardii TaxID=49495 RepID=A0A8T2R2R9_CERRI|nr:hypothetical protein KP509_30G039300 [Ceratopteris richardii]
MNPIISLAMDALANADLRKYSGAGQFVLSQWNPECLGFELTEALLCHIYKNEREGAVPVFMTGWEDITTLNNCLKSNPLLGNPNKVRLLARHGAVEHNVFIAGDILHVWIWN